MRMDTRLPMMVQPPDFVNALSAGTQAAAMQNDVTQQNALRNFLAQSGGAVMAGDQNALAQLAQFDPNAALGVMDQRQGMDARALSMEATQIDMEAARQQMRMAAEEAARSMTAAERQQQLDALESTMSQAAGLYEQGRTDPNAIPAFNAYMEQNGLEVTWDQFPQLAATMEPVADALANYREITGVADPMAPNDRYRNIGDNLIDLGAPGGPVPVDLGLPEPAPEPGFRFATPEELKQAGATAGQIGPDNRFYATGTSTAPVVNVNNGPNTSQFAQELDKQAATRFGGYIEAGQGASALIGDLQILAELAPRVGTGMGAEIKARLGPLAELVGVDIAGLDETQAFQSIVDRVVPTMRPPGSGAASDFDGKMFLSALPNLGRTPEGNAIINETFSALLRHRQEAARLAMQATDGRKSWQEAEAEIMALGNPYETFNQYRTVLEGGDGVGAASGAPPAPTGNATPPRVVTTDAEYDALPSGAVFTDETGARFQKP